MHAPLLAPAFRRTPAVLWRKTAKFLRPRAASAGSATAGRCPSSRSRPTPTQDRPACLAAIMDDFLTKSVRIGQLAAALQRWLSAARPA
jgi:hypothetical protein